MGRVSIAGNTESRSLAGFPRQPSEVGGVILEQCAISAPLSRTLKTQVREKRMHSRVSLGVSVVNQMSVWGQGPGLFVLTVNEVSPGSLEAMAVTCSIINLVPAFQIQRSQGGNGNVDMHSLNQDRVRE